MTVTKLRHIRTPTDLRPAIGSHASTINWLLPPDAEVERIIRHAVDAIMTDLQYIGHDDADLISSYLDSIEEPLNELSSVGFSLSYAIGSGPAKWGEVAFDDWRTAYFVVSESPLVFAAMADDQPSLLHLMNCCNATKEQIVLQKGEGIFALRRGFVPPEWFEVESYWCAECWIAMSLTREPLKAHFAFVADSPTEPSDHGPQTTEPMQDTELQSIKKQFDELETKKGIEPTQRGYALESLVGRLCLAHHIGYDPPIRLPGQQIDGAIKFDGRVLVLECRWRKDKADFGDIQKLSGKARLRLIGTLGLFISMAGFSDDGVDAWLQSGHQRDCILLQGSELRKVIEGFVAWPDALRQAIDQASVRGQVLVNLQA